MQPRFTIGEMARESGLSNDTIRYYESRQLLDKPPRTEAGYRLYSKKDLVRLEFINHAKEAGFTLKEIQELLNIKKLSTEVCGTVQGKVIEKIELTERKIKQLLKIKEMLSSLLNQCESKNPRDSDCPILEAFEKEECR